MAATKGRAKKPRITAGRGKPGASPITGAVPPVEHRFSSTNQPSPERRSGPAVNLHTVGEAIREAAKAKVKGRYSNRFLARVKDAFGFTDEELEEMTVAELVAAVAEAGALMGDFRFWDRFVERNEGKVASRTELTGKDGEPIKVEDGRDRLAEAIQRHAAAAAAPVGDDPSDGGEADPSSED